MAAAMARGWAAGPGWARGDAVLATSTSRRAGGAGRRAGRRVALAGSWSSRGDSDVAAAGGQAGALSRRSREELGGVAPRCSRCSRPRRSAACAEVFPGVPVLRLMPNQPVEVQPGRDLPRAARAMPTSFMAGCCAAGAARRRSATSRGASYRCSDGDHVAARPHTSPLVAEALAAAASGEGLDAERRRRARRRGVRRDDGAPAAHDPATIRDAVASPGGATEAGLAQLERSGASDAFVNAVNASLERFR